ncbi:hypothetical protein N9J15_03415 [Porticoccaceae bacterium]|nr:hypothetical protein [Porticoccaceae bacterium]
MSELLNSITMSINMKISLGLFLFPLSVLPFLWDYYAFGLKILDILAIGIALFCLIFLKSSAFDRILKKRILFFLLFFSIYALIGLIVHLDVKGFVGLILGMMFFVCVCLYFNPEDVNKYSHYILLLMIVTFLVQFGVGVIRGTPLNYHWMIGLEPRLLYGQGMRTAGLFLEPTSFCSMMFMIITTRFLHNSYGRLELIGILTILMSLSLFGIFASLFLLAYWILFNPKLLSLLTKLSICIIPLLIFAGFNAESWMPSQFYYLLFERLPDIGSDTSVLSRYKLSDTTQLSNFSLLFGLGLATLNSGVLGSSGFGYLISGVGLIGFLFFLCVSVNLYRRRTLFIMTNIVVILMSSYYWTFLVFWMWLAWMYISVAKQHINSDNIINKEFASGSL